MAPRGTFDDTTGGEIAFRKAETMVRQHRLPDDTGKAAVAFAFVTGVFLLYAAAFVGVIVGVMALVLTAVRWLWYAV